MNPEVRVPVGSRVAGPFVIQVLVLLPAFFFLWYQAGPWIAPLLAKLLEPILKSVWPLAIQAVKPSGPKLIVIAQLQHPITHSDLAGYFVYSDKGILVSPYTYAFGLPMYAALAIASTARWGQHALRLVAGLVILSGGVCFTVVVSLMYIFQLDSSFPQITWFAHKSDNDMLVRYGHFIGFQLVPRVLPLLLWALFYRDTLREILGVWWHARPAEQPGERVG